MADLARCYVQAHPSVDVADVVGAVRWWLAYTAASTYPFGDLLRGEAPTGGNLARFRRSPSMTIEQVSGMAGTAPVSAWPRGRLRPAAVGRSLRGPGRDRSWRKAGR